MKTKLHSIINTIFVIVLLASFAVVVTAQDAEATPNVESTPDVTELQAQVDEYTQTIEANPDDAEAYFNRGVVYYQQERYEQAIADFDKAIELEPNYAEAYYNRGWVYLLQNDFQHGIDDETSAIELGSVQAYLLRGTAYVIAKKYQAGLDDFAKYKEITGEPIPDSFTEYQYYAKSAIWGK